MSLRALKNVSQRRTFYCCRSIGKSYPKKALLRPFSSTASNWGEEECNKFQPFFVTALSSRGHPIVKPSTFTEGPHLRSPCNNKEYLLVLLATPESLDQAKGEDEIVQSFLQHHFGNSLDVSFSVLVAVVDAIPLVKKYLPPSEREHLKPGAFNNPLGYQGVSIAVLELSHAAPEIWSEQNVSRSLPQLEGALPHLSFELFEGERPFLALQLPLANTLFKNGKRSTLYLRQWSKTKAGTKEMSFIPGTTLSLVSQKINIQRSTSESSPVSGVAIDSILRKITKPKAVSDANGNVIRALMTDSGATEPASQELEEAINALSRESSYADRRIEVWALVTSKVSPNPTRPSQDDEEPKLDVSGSWSIFKVLSGGGGWGEKRGLLSLGSNTDFQGHNVAPSSEDDSYRLSIYPNLVKPGNLVTFAVVDADKLAEKQKSLGYSQTQRVNDNVDILGPAIQFGSIPSTIDDMPTNPRLTLEGHDYLPHTRVHGFFGALSSQGLHLSTESGSKTQSGSKNAEKHINTIIDAPYATVSVYGRNKRSSVRNEDESSQSSVAMSDSCDQEDDKVVIAGVRNEDYQASTVGPRDVQGSTDTEKSPSPVESRLQIHRYTSMPFQKNETQSRQDFSALTDASQSTDEGKRKTYTDALLQGLPATEALKLADLEVETKKRERYMVPFRIRRLATKTGTNELTDKQATEK